MAKVATDIVAYRMRQAFALLLTGIILGASILRTIGSHIHEIYWIQEWLGGDLATHFLMGAGLCLAGLLLVETWSGMVFNGVFAAVLVLLFLEETSQLFLPSRSFQWLDLALGVAGAGLMFLACWCLGYQARRATQG